MPIWFINIISHVGFKIISVILALALIGLALFSWIKLHDAKVMAKALASCPPQIAAASGSIIKIDQRVNKMACFPIPAIAHFGIGICHD